MTEPCLQCEVNADLIQQLQSTIEEQNRVLLEQADVMQQANELIKAQGIELQQLRFAVTEYRNTMNTMALIRSRSNGS